VIDFGDLRVGDPALYLAAGLILLPTDVVDRFLAAYRPAAYGADSASGALAANGADAAALRRARGWAVIKTLVCLSSQRGETTAVPAHRRGARSPALLCSVSPQPPLDSRSASEQRTS
jgi:hypothetical protein